MCLGFLKIYIYIYACSYNHNFFYASICVSPFDRVISVISNTSVLPYIHLFWEYSLGEPWGFLPDGDAFVFVDNHATQRCGPTILTYKVSKLYKVTHM